MLSKFEYQKNIALLHTDDTVMAKSKLAWASWNYVIDKDKQGQLKPYTVYYMNSLQQVSKKRDYFVNINGEEYVNPAKVLKRIEYDHPIFTVPAFTVQKDLHLLNQSGPVYFCGSYFKYGFHEDAFTSAVELCNQLLGKNVWGE
jgi:predicted NAD/FAD-binding protein